MGIGRAGGRKQSQRSGISRGKQSSTGNTPFSGAKGVKFRNVTGGPGLSIWVGDVNQVAEVIESASEANTFLEQ